MPDIVSFATRSRMMAAIRGKNTKPELIVRSALHRRGFRYRLHSRDLPGRPDVVLPKWNAVIFVHGCFWHGHDCHLYRLPATRTEFWQAKITRNRAVDARAIKALRKEGWRVALVWECALKGKLRLPIDSVADQCARWLVGSKAFLEFRGIAGSRSKVD